MMLRQTKAGHRRCRCERRRARPAQRLSPRSPSEAIQPMPRRRRRPLAERRRGLVVDFSAGSCRFVMVLARARSSARLHRQASSTRPARLPPTRSSSSRRASAPARSPTSCKREGVIDQPFLFDAPGLRSTGSAAQLKAGEYQFQRARQPRRGDGHARRRQGHPALAHHPGRPDQRADRRAPPRERHPRPATSPRCPREGTLLPDTYKFERGMTPPAARQPHAAGAARRR